VRVQTELYGCLALTGRGHTTDRAIIPGLCREHPAFVEVERIESRLANIRELRILPLRGLHAVDRQGFLATADEGYGCYRWGISLLPARFLEAQSLGLP
jgi:hypothetical protein